MASNGSTRNASVAGFILKWGLLMMCIFFGRLAHMVTGSGVMLAKGTEKGTERNSKPFHIIFTVILEFPRCHTHDSHYIALCHMLCHMCLSEMSAEVKEC